MTNFCGCNWNLGHTCYLHTLAWQVERAQARVKAGEAGAVERLAEVEAAYRAQAALYDAALARAGR